MLGEVAVGLIIPMLYASLHVPLDVRSPSRVIVSCPSNPRGTWFRDMFEMPDPSPVLPRCPLTGPVSAHVNIPTQLDFGEFFVMDIV
jgi:hypothetical protein